MQPHFIAFSVMLILLTKSVLKVSKAAFLF